MLFDEELTELTGTTENIIFSAQSGGFSVFRLRPEQKASPVTVTVNAPAPLVGQQVKVKGEWVTHPRFGKQLKAHTIQLVAPTSAAGIERFLASGVIKGVGPVMARRLVAAFGENTLKIIEEQPKKLTTVPGIGKKTAEGIVASYREKSELSEIMLWLESHGASGTYAARIFKKYGSFSLAVLQNTPYRLAYDIDGIGFLTADAIALAAGKETDSPDRLEAGLNFALIKVSSEGHCCLPVPMLVDRAQKLLRVEREYLYDAVKAGCEANRFIAEDTGGEEYIYAKYLYEAECDTAGGILRIDKNAVPLLKETAEELTDEWEKSSGLNLGKDQRKAVSLALSNGVFVLTGGPGTGKTTIVRAILDIFEGNGDEVLLAAPTGRAAKRLAETTGRKAQTVHRLLEAQGADGERMVFARNENEPLEADVVIIDEVSMMDILLTSQLLKAIPDGCRLILVGDADQLPAVGPGSVLKDILRSGAVADCRLTEIFRQAGQSAIVLNAHAINHGRDPKCTPGSDFEFLRTSSEQEAEALVIELCTKLLPAHGFDPLTDVQVLSPMHLQVCGIDSLNKKLQASFNPPAYGKGEWASGSVIFREGDKVMQTKNNYMKGVFNGDIGFVETCGVETMTVRFGDEEATSYTRGEASELSLAYAMSVHKSQGSEYPVIVLPLVPGHHIMLQRNLLYTAVTRAKEKVIITGSLNALQTAVANDRTRKRLTLLSLRLNHNL